MENTTSNVPRSLIVDATTGQITSEIYEDDRVSITRAAQDHYAATHVINFNKDKSFVKIYDDVVPLLEKYLTPREFRFAICLAPHVSFEDCIIRQSKDRRSKPINIKELAELHEMNYDTTKKIMQSLKQKGVIGKHETGSILHDYNGRYGTIYTVNPFIYFRGSDMLNPVYSFYMESGWQELLAKETNEVN